MTHKAKPNPKLIAKITSKLESNPDDVLRQFIVSEKNFQDARTKLEAMKTSLQKYIEENGPIVTENHIAVIIKSMMTKYHIPQEIKDQYISIEEWGYIKVTNR